MVERYMIRNGIRAVQELKDVVKSLKQENNALKAKLEAAEEKLSR